MISDYCRICGALFEQYESKINFENDTEFKNKILKYFNINLDNIFLANITCMICKRKINEFFDFELKVKKSQSVLNNLSNEYAFKNLKETSVYILSEETDPDDMNDSLLCASKSKVENSIERKKAKIWLKKKKLRENSYYTCCICKENWASLREYRGHFAKLHNGLPIKYYCNVCGKETDKLDLYYRHARDHRDVYRFQCEKCKKHFPTKSRLKKHEIVHSDSREFVCNICNKQFKRIDSLKTHAQSHLPEEAKKTYSCTVCEKVFSSATSLYLHNVRHFTDFSFSCEQCGKEFKHKNNLSEHLKTVHTEMRPYCCNQCPKTFKSRRYLRNHILVHSDARPYECDNCKQRFRTKDLLNRHQIVHTNKFPFQCNYCQKKFRRRKGFKVHLRQHTGEKPYRCDECNRAFTDVANYYKHMKRRHNVISMKQNLIEITSDNQDVKIFEQDIKENDQDLKTVNQTYIFKVCYT